MTQLSLFDLENKMTAKKRQKRKCIIISCVLMMLGCYSCTKNDANSISKQAVSDSECSAIPLSPSEMTGWYCLANGQYRCLAENGCVYQEKAYSLGNTIPEGEVPGFPMWKATDEQLHPMLHANFIDSDKPLNVPWKCNAERCPLSDGSEMTIPKNAFVFRGNVYCGKNEFPTSKLSINDYNCKYVSITERDWNAETKEYETREAFVWLWVCGNRENGCKALMHRYDKECEDYINYGVAIRSNGEELSHFYQEGEECENGDCECGNHRCGKGQYCIEGECWFHGEHENAFSEFVFERCGGPMGTSDCESYRVCTYCNRKGGCWTDNGIHYPEGAEADFAHDDSGSERSEYCTPKRKDHIKPLSESPENASQFFCDSETCLCGEQSCRKGEICRSGKCEHITCQADKSSKKWISPSKLYSIYYDDVNSGEPQAYSDEIFEELSKYIDADDDNPSIFDTRGCISPAEKARQKQAKNDVSKQSHEQALITNEKPVAKVPKPECNPPAVEKDGACRCSYYRAPGNGFECMNLDGASKPLWVCTLDEGCALKDYDYSIKKGRPWNCSSHAKKLEHGCFCNGEPFDSVEECEEKYPYPENKEHISEFLEKKSDSVEFLKGLHYYEFHSYYIYQKYSKRDYNLFHWVPFNVELATGKTCDVTQGCMCNGMRCPMSGICTETGCIDPITQQAFKQNNGYIEAGLYKLCANDDGCDCNGTYCKAGAACVGGFCSPEFGLSIKDGNYYISENVVCDDEMWKLNDPNAYICSQDYYISAAFFSDRSHEPIGTIRCARPEGCQCGESICPYHSECREGACYYDITYAHEMCDAAYDADEFRDMNSAESVRAPADVVSNTGLCACNGTFRQGEFLPYYHLKTEFINDSSDCGIEHSDWVCSEHGWQCVDESCACGNATCSKGSVCIKPNLCTQPIPLSPDKKPVIKRGFYHPVCSTVK